MNISTLSPIKQLPKPEEVSHLRSPRDSATAYNSWKREKEIVSGYNQVIQLVNQLARDMKRLSERRKLDFDMFPFKIYSIPSELQNSYNWLNFNVRGGYVFTQTDDTGSCFVNGTDRMELYSYQSTLPNPIINGQYTIPTGSLQYWFWIETSGSSTANTSSYWLRSSNTPQTPDSLYNPNGWPNWPSAISGNFIIGFVDSATSAAANIAIVRQIQIGDILAAPSSGSSGATRYVTAQIFGDYYKCFSLTGNFTNTSSYTIGSTPIWVAKPPELRHVLAGEFVEGTPVTYSYSTRANNNDGQRTATVGGSVISQIEIIQPVYHCSSSLAGDGQYSEIWADMPSGGTGCTGSTEAGGAGTGSLLIWMDTNRSARKWNWVS